MSVSLLIAMHASIPDCGDIQGAVPPQGVPSASYPVTRNNSHHLLNYFCECVSFDLRTCTCGRHFLSIALSSLQVSRSTVERNSHFFNSFQQDLQLLPCQLPYLESMLTCVGMNWMTILVRTAAGELFLLTWSHAGLSCKIDPLALPLFQFVLFVFCRLVLQAAASPRWSTCLLSCAVARLWSFQSTVPWTQQTLWADSCRSELQYMSQGATQSSTQPASPS